MKSNARLLAVSLITAGLTGGVNDSAAKPPPVVPIPQAKHIILFIGDGMQLEHEIATSQYLYGTPYGLVWHQADYRAAVSTWDVTTYDFRAESLGLPSYDPLNFDPVVGYDPKLGGRRPWPLDLTGQLPYFLDWSWFTDSASSATAWATGYKTDDGNIAWLPGDPDNGALRTIAEYMREKRGASIGVVSTVPFSHATPAAHVSHNKSRNRYFQIADEILRVTQPEVVIGGGQPVLGLGDLPDLVEVNGESFRKIGLYSSDGTYWDYPEWGIFADADVHYGVFYEAWGGYAGVHSNELTMLNAWGKGINALATKQGKWYPGTQIIDNTQIFQALCEAAGITPE